LEEPDNTESSIRALRQQFGVPSEGSCVTLVVYGLCGTRQSRRRTKATTSPYFHPFGVARQGLWDTVEKVAGGPIDGLKSGKKRPKSAFWYPIWARSGASQEFFNSLTPSRHFGE